MKLTNKVNNEQVTDPNQAMINQAMRFGELNHPQEKTIRLQDSAIVLIEKNQQKAIKDIIELLKAVQNKEIRYQNHIFVNSKNQELKYCSSLSGGWHTYAIDSLHRGFATILIKNLLTFFSN